MALTPMDMLIERANLRCTRCGAPMSEGCDCHRDITIRCPDCGRLNIRGRLQPGDPQETASIECLCPECVTEDCDVKFFDKAGRELTPNAKLTGDPPQAERPVQRTVGRQAHKEV